MVRITEPCGFLVRAEEQVAAKDAEAAPAESGVLMEGFSESDEKLLEANKQSFTFQAEVNRLMDIIINSLCKCLLAQHIARDMKADSVCALTLLLVPMLSSFRQEQRSVSP